MAMVDLNILRTIVYNAPHTKWQHLSSFPQHFHSKSDSNVIESTLNSEPESAVRDFLTFARKLLSEIANLR